MVNVTDPSAALSCATTVQRWLLPPPGLVTVSVLVASDPANLMAQVGVVMVSDEVNASDIVSPSLDSVLTALLDVKATLVRVGTVRSAVQEKVLDAEFGFVTESV